MERRSWGTVEFLDCAVEDKREAKSLAAMADKLLEHPELAFSSAVGKNMRQAAWRIFSKEDVDISYGHYRQTAKRCEEHPLVLVSHDTTDLNFAGHHASQGLGDLGGAGSIPGLCLHTALALTPKGLPLGLVGQKIWAPVAQWEKEKKRKTAKLPLEQKESYRWVEALSWVGRHLQHVKQVVILSDRESDFYEYFAAPRPEHVKLLFRVHHLQRHVFYQEEKLPLRQVSFHNGVEVAVLLPKTSNRQQRTATLHVSWGQIQIPPSANRKGEKLSLYLVKAIEKDPPQDQKPVKWYMLTTLAVEEQAEALQVLDYYRRRWIIERWHLVLKDGMKVEKLQFDAFKRLSQAIAMIAIVAWQLLLLKQLAVHAPDMDVEEVFETTEIEVLKEKSAKTKLTVRQALLIIAALAGFVSSKKQPLPGEKTIWRGWHIFSSMCQGYKLASQKNYATG